MSDMVDVVARAIEAAELRYKAENGGDDESCVECPDEVKARAAIAALREPTEAMIRAGENTGVSYDEELWQAMIDSALNPSPSAEKGR